MAQRKCPECGRMVSSHANNCQHCGYVIDDYDHQRWAEDDARVAKWRKIKLVFWVVVILILLIVIF